MNLIPISIGILNSRPAYMKECVNSIARQVYPPELIDLVVIDNLDKKHTIGQGYNLITKFAKNDWILIVGDDDFISRTYLFNLAVFLDTAFEKVPKYKDHIVALTTNLTIISTEKRLPVDVCPTGMWSKKFLEQHPWDESLPRYVDTDMFARVKSMGKIIIHDQTNHGYYYRQHDANVSYNKFSAKTKVLNEIQNKEARNII